MKKNIGLIGILIICCQTAYTKEFSLFPNDAVYNKKFGISVSISGDYAVVGAVGSTLNGVTPGGAYFYKKINNCWEFLEKHLSKAIEYDSYGFSVAISGDIAVVGAIYDDDQDPNEGAVYVYKLDKNTDKWIFSQKLYANDASESSLFGYSISISDNNLIVGAAHERENGSFGGSVYIYKKRDDGWGDCQKISAYDGKQGDQFGYSVSISDNYALVGAKTSSDCAGNNSGSVYFYKKNETSYSFIQKVCASDADYNDQFGCSVSINDKYAVIGANQKNDRSGSAYIFKNEDNNWIEIQKLNGKTGDWFGTAVSIDGNILVIGANHYSSGLKAGTGIVYLYKLINNNWEYYTSLEANDRDSLDVFGSSVSIFSENILIGADGKNSSTGKAYIYSNVLEELTISGNIANAQSVPISNARIETSIKQVATSDSSGFFSLTIPYSFSGRVSVFMNDYTIPSTFKQYTNVRNDISGEKFIIENYSISGLVTDTLNNPIPGIQIHFSNGGGISTTNIVTTSDNSGFFSLTFPYSFSGRVSVFMNDYTIPSTFKQYTNVRNDISGEKFIIEDYSISGLVTDTLNNPIPGIQIYFSNGGGISTTNINGYFTHNVYKSWNGMILPSGRGYKFTPPYISIDNISNHYSDQLFKGSKLSISGYVFDEIKNPVEGVKLVINNLNNMTVITDKYGFYVHEIDKNWAGNITPEKDTCKFDPSYTSYSAVTANYNNQNYYCITKTPTLEVSSDILNLTSKSGFSYITISSNGLPFNKYSASIDQDSWLNISKLESAVLIIHQENDQYSDRIATLTISAGNQSKTIQLIQKSKTLELDWNVDISRFQFQGNITAIVKDSDGIIIQSDNDILAAFVGDECRGKAFLSPVSDGKRFFLQVWSNKLSETMTFKYFDSNQQLVFDYLKPTIEFSPDIEMGNISSPFELTLLGNKVFPDANDDGTVDLFDVINVLQYLSNTNYLKWSMEK